MNYRKLRKNVKAISPVLSVLMMIAVAVAASLVTYAWVMGYLGFATNKVGKAIQIQSIARDGSGLMTVYVQNVGDSDVSLSSVFVNGTLPIPAPEIVGGSTAIKRDLIKTSQTVGIDNLPANT